MGFELESGAFLDTAAGLFFSGQNTDCYTVQRFLLIQVILLDMFVFTVFSCSRREGLSSVALC